VARGDADESVCAAQTESAENNVESCSAGTTCEPAATEESFSNPFYRNIIQIMLMWVQSLCTDTMRAKDYQSTDASIAGGLAVAALLAALLVVASYPVQFALLTVALGATYLLTRTVWRRVTTRGLTLPGAAGRLCVRRDGQNGSGTRWAVTVAVVED